MTNGLAGILTGANDEDLLYDLYVRIESPSNPSQLLFVDAWELTGFIAGDGFEFLFEQDRSLDEFAQVLVEIGFSEAYPIFMKVKGLVPDAMLTKEYDSELREHLANNFDILRELLSEYLDLANAHLLSAFGSFIRDQRGDFADHLRSDTNDG